MEIHSVEGLSFNVETVIGASEPVVVMEINFRGRWDGGYALDADEAIALGNLLIAVAQAAKEDQ